MPASGAIIVSLDIGGSRPLCLLEVEPAMLSEDSGDGVPLIVNRVDLDRYVEGREELGRVLRTHVPQDTPALALMETINTNIQHGSSDILLRDSEDDTHVEEDA